MHKKNVQKKTKSQPAFGVGERFRQFSKKFSKIFIGCFVGSLVLFSCFKIRDPDWLPINKVSIVGAYDHVDKHALQQVITPRVNCNFWFVDVSGIKQEVEKLPWVFQATVKKHWPDTVIVDIQQRQAITRWNGEALISMNEEVFYPNREISHQLPALYGPEGSHKEVVAGFREMQTILHPLGLRIKAVRVDKRHAWQLDLDNDIQLLLGRDQYQQRLQRFTQVYGRVLDFREADIASVDLRYGHGMAVRWKKQV